MRGQRCLFAAGLRSAPIALFAAIVVFVVVRSPGLLAKVEELKVGNTGSFASATIAAVLRRSLVPGAYGDLIALRDFRAHYHRGAPPSQAGGAPPAGDDGTARVLPSMIVFDLDGTLWWPEMYSLDARPSAPVRGSLGDGLGDGVVGLQVPPDGPTVTLFPGALAVLQTIVRSPEYDGVLIAAASTSEEPAYSYACLENLEILPGLPMRDVFDYVEIGRTGRLSKYKTEHFRLIHEESGVPYDEMLFFDDCNWQNHVLDMSRTYGVIGQETPEGLTVEDFKLGLKKYQQARSECLSQQKGFD